MAFHFDNFNVVDIDLENDDNDHSQNESQNSVDEEISQLSFTDSDLHEFQKMEKDIYGDEHSVEEISKPSDDVTDEQSESLEFIRPNITVRPSLGDPFRTYDQLQSQFTPKSSSQLTQITESQNQLPIVINKSITPVPSTTNRPLQSSPPHKSRASSRESGGSAETVLSQNQSDDDTPAIYVSQMNQNNRNKIELKRSSPDTIEHQTSKQSHSRTHIHTLLSKERQARKEQEKYIEHLHHSIQQLQSKHALAEETIDQLRLGVPIEFYDRDDRSKLRRRSYQKRRPTTNKSQTLNRRYSSIVNSSEIPDFSSDTNLRYRAQSVDMTIFDESHEDDGRAELSTPTEHDSLKMVPKRKLSRNQLSEISDDLHNLSATLQTRGEIIEEAIQNLNLTLDGASSSSGSTYGDYDGRKSVNEQRQMMIKDRLKNIREAFESLKYDAKTGRELYDQTKNSHGTNVDDFGEQTDSNLFTLAMQLDDLERRVKNNKSDLSGSTDKRPKSKNHEQDLLARMENLEIQYQNLISRYNSLKLTRSPSRQKELDDIVQKLQKVVAEANDASPNVASQNELSTLLTNDKINSMKQHMTSTSPPYFMTEDDQLSSATSSFGKGRWRTKKGHQPSRSEEDSDFRNESGERLSPIKSRMSAVSLRDDRDSYEYNKLSSKPNSVPVSVVSSSSMWLGATSGETLPLDENGVLKENFRRNTPKINGNASRKSSIKHQFLNSQSLENSTDVERSVSRPNSSGLHDLDDEVKRLDQQLAMVELEEKKKNRGSTVSRESDTGVSRHTRSLLGTSPSEGNLSRQSKLLSSVPSSHKSFDNNLRNSGSGSSNKSPSRSNHRKKRNHVPITYLSESEDNDESSTEADETLDYAKASSSGLGNRSRFIRRKDSNLRDRWSQTPDAFTKYPKHRSFDHDVSPDFEDPYIDSVDYWNGVAFHPAREGIPGKSILRPPSKFSRNKKSDLHNRHSYYRSEPLNLSYPSFSKFSLNPQTETTPVREYALMAPHRYFVREYGSQNRLPMYDDSGIGYDDDYDDGDGLDELSDYRKMIEERRLCRYLDEAIQAARSMKQYTNRINELCQQRQMARDPDIPFYNRSFRNLYT